MRGFLAMREFLAKSMKRTQINNTGESNATRTNHDRSSKRVEAERLAVEAKEKAEAANLNHRRKINNEIKSLLVDFGLDDETAISIIKLAAQGKLGALTVKY